MELTSLLTALLLAGATPRGGAEEGRGHRRADGEPDIQLRYHHYPSPSSEESQRYYPYHQEYESPHYYPAAPCQPGLSGLDQLAPLSQGLVGGVAKALAAGLSAKLPLILFKIFLKVGLLYLALPLVASLVVPVVPVNVTGNFTSSSRRRSDEGGAAGQDDRRDACLRRFACLMGAHSSATLDLARSMKHILESAGPEAKYSIKSCREAYIKGKAEKTCRHHYPCEYLDDFIQMLS